MNVGGVWVYPHLAYFLLRPELVKGLSLIQALAHSFIRHEEASLSEHSSGKAVLISTRYMMHLKPKHTDYLNPKQECDF